ncbi:MAG TPA: GNAT family N-acetyltransferase [Parachlamydiaceae bacterium]|nr:GNAT family N-acetyltransferase [Parachlamydiaceae bacterium]
MLKFKARKTKDGYELKILKKEEMEQIRIARNEQINVLRQKKEISKAKQIAYFEEIVAKEQQKKYPNLILFSLFKNDTWIGYGGLVHIDWDHLRAEVSFLLDTKRAQNEDLYRKDFENYLELLFPIAFNHLKLKRLHTETFDFRTFQIKLLEDLGFSYEGTLKNHVLIRGEPHDSILHGILREDVKIVD